MKTRIPCHFPILLVTMNSSRIAATLRSTMLLTFMFCFLTATITSHVDGCSVQVIDIQQCLAAQSQSNSSMFIDSICCKSLNQIVEAGFYCLCSLVRNSPIGLVSPLLLISLSNCLISVPPLNLCREMLVPSPPHQVHAPLPPTNFRMDDNNNNSTTYSATKQQQQGIECGDDRSLCVLSNGSYNTRVCLWKLVLLSLLILLLLSKYISFF